MAVGGYPVEAGSAVRSFGQLQFLCRKLLSSNLRAEVPFRESDFDLWFSHSEICAFLLLSEFREMMKMSFK